MTATVGEEEGGTPRIVPGFEIALSGDVPPETSRPLSNGGQRPWLSAVLSGSGGLALVGFSLGLCVWELWFADRLRDFVVTNGPSRARGVSAVVSALAGAGVVLLVSLGLLAARRLARAEAIERLSRRLSPLALAAFLPLMFRWRLWQGDRDVIFLLLALLLVFGVQRLLQVAFSTEPVFGRPGFLDKTFKDGKELWQWSETFLPFAVVCLAAAGYATFFAYHTVVHHRNVLSTSLDLGLEENVIWHALHSGSLFKTTPYGGPTGNMLGEHAPYLNYLIAPIYALHQSAETILVLQAALVGGAAIPLYLVARKYLGPWLSCLVAVWYLFYPPVHGSNLYDFHYPPLAPFFLWFTLFFVLARRNVWAAVFTVLTLSVREDISFGLMIVGIFLTLTNRRPRAGLLLIVTGAAYFVAMKLIIMPIQRGGQEAFLYMFTGLLPEGGQGFGGVLKTVIANPAFTLGVVLERDKLIYLLEIFLPLAFFPLRRMVGLLCCVPGFLFTLLSTGYRPLYQISFQYTAHWTAYLFIAVIANLSWLGREAVRHGREGTGRKRAWVAAISLAMLVTTYQLGALIQHHAVRGGFGIYHFGTDSEDWERRQKLHALIAMVPPKAKIVSSENIVPQISNRPYSYTLRMGIADADYLLFSVPAGGDERAKALEVLTPGTFGVVSERGQFVLAKRGYPTDLNRGVLARVGH